MVTIGDLNRDLSSAVSLDDDPQFVPLSESGSIVETLSSATRRAIVVEVCHEPLNAAEVADRIDTSIQNVRYHLAALKEAGLVSVVGTHYSDKGLEMDVYAPTSTVIVIDVDGASSHDSTSSDDAEDDAHPTRANIAQ